MSRTVEDLEIFRQASRLKFNTQVCKERLSIFAEINPQKGFWKRLDSHLKEGNNKNKKKYYEENKDATKDII